MRTFLLIHLLILSLLVLHIYAYRRWIFLFDIIIVARALERIPEFLLFNFLTVSLLGLSI